MGGVYNTVSYNHTACVTLKTWMTSHDARAEKAMPMPERAMGNSNFSPLSSCLLRMMRSEETAAHSRMKTTAATRRARLREKWGRGGGEERGKERGAKR